MDNRDVLFAAFIGVLMMPFGAVLGVLASRVIASLIGRGMLARFGDIDIGVGIAVSWTFGFAICLAMTRDELPTTTDPECVHVNESPGGVAANDPSS